MRALQGAESTSEIADAMERFLMQRFRLAPGRLCRDQTIGALRAAGRYDLAIRVERLYRADPTASTTPAKTQELEAIKQEAITVVDEIGRGRLRQTPTWKREGLRSTTASLWMCLPLTLASGGLVDAASITLSDQQKQVLLQEGVQAYQSGLENPDQVEAADSFRQAVDKFQVLVDSGIRNDRLYFNLAEASRRSGQLGPAIANYRRALRLVPDHPTYFQRLQQTEQLAGVVAAETEASVVATLRQINDAALRWISPDWLPVGVLVGWVAFWVVVSAYILQRLSAWKGMAALSLGLTLLTASSYLLRTSEFTSDPRAVLISSTIPLREGDGEEFAELTTITEAEGRQVKLIEQRANWLHVVMDNGQAGWISADHGIVL
jgi:hypothetical protein